jgi:alkylhydroperoxidase family enzyme
MTIDPATNGAPRLAPITEPTPEIADLLAKGGMNGPGGTPLNIFGTLAHHPALMRRWMVFATHVLSKSTLTPRDRELVILRIGARCRSQYEFSQHAIIARRSDISDAEIEATKAAIDAHPWSTKDAALIRAADELHDDARISDPTWATLTAELSTEQVMDVVFAVGQYNLVSMFLNTAGVQLDEGVPAAL